MRRRLPGMLALLLAVGCTGEHASDAETTESGLSAVTFADVLGGGQFECKEAGRGNVVVSLTPAVGERARSNATLSGRISVFDYPANDPPVTLSLDGGELSGTRGINYGDIGHGYYCGGGPTINCGPERRDGVRFFVDGGDLRCEVTMTRDEPWANNWTSKVSGRPTRYVPPVAPATPSVFGANTGTDVVEWGTGSLSGFQVSIPTSVNLQEFGVVASHDGSKVIMALYTDVGGHPGALVASTAPTPLSGADQRIAPIAPAALPAGSYWIMGEFDGNGPFHGRTPMRVTRGASTNWIAHTFGAALPTTIPQLNTAPTVRLNFYVVVQ